ncbi:MAG TPA: hypothetical protein DCX14_14615 [Flavobacteriales bacterium]|jgi:4-hydroxybenzoate polyprenyltransferase|nr:hypothetical protein [Flavobacteriales bacterium]
MRLIASLVYSNFFVAIVLSCLATSTFFIEVDLIFDWRLIVFIFLASFLLYSFHRIYKLDSIPLNLGGARHHWVKENYRTTLVAMTISLVGLFVLLPNLSPNTLFWLAPAALISLGYTVPLIPYESKWIRIRDIPLVKPFVIALIVSYLTYSFPILDQRGSPGVLHSAHYAALFERFLFLLIVTIPFEVRDLKSDKSAHLKTLATTLGSSNATRLCYVLAFIWALMAILVSSFEPLRLAGISAIFVLMVVALFKLDRVKGELGYALVFEGLIILYAGVYATSSFFALP